MQERADIILRGHLHENEVSSVADAHGSCLHLAAGACYQTRKYPNTALICTADLSQRQLQVLPLKYFDGPKPKWDLDTGLFDPPDYAGKFPILNTKAIKFGVIGTGENTEIYSPTDQTANSTNTVSDAIRIEVIGEIKKLLRKSVFPEVGRVLVSNQTLLSPKPEADEWLVPFNIQPFPIVTKVNALRSAIRDVFKSVEEEGGKNLLIEAAAIAKEMLEWLLLLAVPDAWTQGYGSHLVNHSGKPAIDIPEKYALWAELGDGRIHRKKPLLAAEPGLNPVKVFAPNQMGHDDLERGLRHQDALTEVLRMIWIKVMKREPSADDDLKAQLAYTLPIRLEDGDRYHITIPHDRYAAIAGNAVWAKDLGMILAHLGIFIYGSGSGPRVLIAPEDELLVAIREYLRLLRKYE